MELHVTLIESFYKSIGKTKPVNQCNISYLDYVAESMVTTLKFKSLIHLL